MIRINLEETGSPDDDREWLETDGWGGYASSTIENRHTRRYHGLHVANLRKPQGRYLLLSKLEDSLLADGKEYFFSSHRYPGLLFPPGPPLLREFLLDLYPRFIYRAGGACVTKSILMPRQKGILLVRYDLDRCPKGSLLRVKPFLAFRGIHQLARENPFLRTRTEGIENGFRIEPYAGMPPLFFQTSRVSRFTASPVWYNRFQYMEERERGFDWEEDLFLSGILEIPAERRCTIILSVSCRPLVGDPVAMWKTEVIRRGREQAADRRVAYSSQDSPGCGTSPVHPKVEPSLHCTPGLRQAEGIAGDAGFSDEDREFLLALLSAGRAFLITTPSGRPAVIAGYPWFESWGRDTLITLPGLCFESGRIPEGIEILTEVGRHERDGLLPNFFSADGTPEAYNTVDSSLWYFRAVQELLRVTGDREFIRARFWPVMKRIIHAFMGGTRFRIGMDSRGLLHAGDGLTALTWMDAAVGGIPVTPRHGAPVEINALWYNALCLTRDLAVEFGEEAFPGRNPVPLLRRSFRETFWNAAEGCLGDVFRDGILDGAVRPNQIFAVSLPHSPLDPAEQAAVVRTVRERLLTPCGLRTLSPGDPAYRGRYRGNPAERDGAYHQGTVWPWLLGAFGEAALRVAVDPGQEREDLLRHLRTFLRGHLVEAGIGSVSEVFDGDAPHRPGGCIAQAWSVAELIRLYRLLGRVGK
ncbi:MAG: glycogen debranching enzyme N-terminal domain-containing protein [Deltaproteobacteria bacterium]|nr:glycogen debranching enzyme N-terminal domain-containing protein [Deltaproteobacteria bacterium]